MRVKLRFAEDNVEIPNGYINVSKGIIKRNDGYWSRNSAKFKFDSARLTGESVSKFYCIIRKLEPNHPNTKIFL